MKNNLEKMFNPGSVAIVGASDRVGSVGNAITRNLLDLGYVGEVYLVNPKYQELLERKCYSSLSEIEAEIDLAIIVIPSAFVNETIAKATKVKNFIVISAGFSEIGKGGKNRELELAKLAKENDLNILGPNCLGLISPKIKLNASFASGLPEEGGVSFVSQSGALVVAMLDMASKEQIRFSQIISTGNEMQLDEIELIKYLADDEETKVIALYLEGIKDGQKFIQIAREVSAKKPIVVLKAGRGEKAQKAIASHTGSLAGNDEIMETAFHKAGVMRAQNLEDFFILIKLLSNFKNNVGKDCAIVTNAGGPGVLTTDAFNKKTIQLKEFSQETKDKLRLFLPPESSVENPIDLLGDADVDRYRKTLDVLDKEETENILCLMTAQGQTPTEEIAQVVVDFYNKSQKNILPIFIGGEKIDKALEILRKNKIPNFNFPQKAVDALNQMIVGNEKNISKNKDEISSSNFFKNIFKKKNDNSIVAEAKNKNKKALLFGEAASLMKQYSIPTIKYLNIISGDDVEQILSGNLKEIEFPVVLKVDSETVLHKTDKQGLILNIDNEEELAKHISEMQASFPQENLIVQPMLSTESELILGLKRDVIFGPVIVFGLGGIYTEVFKMIDFMLLPLSKDEIKKTVLESKVGFLFKETRGKKVGNIDEMTELIFNFARLVKEQEEIREIDINPLLITKEGKLVAVDVKVIL